MRTMKRLHQIIVTVALTVTVATQLGHAETNRSIMSITDRSTQKIFKQVSEDEQLAKTLNRKDLWPLPQEFSDSDKKHKVSKQEISCLAHNIYYEAGYESTEGKIAVGLVTLNRLADNDFPKSVCAVVRQKTQGKCQFSWNCQRVRVPKYKGWHWADSVRIARELLEGKDEYDVYRIKYSQALYFHHQHKKTDWDRVLVKIDSSGSNVFYKGKFN